MSYQPRHMIQKVRGLPRKVQAMLIVLVAALATAASVVPSMAAGSTGPQAAPATTVYGCIAFDSQTGTRVMESTFTSLTGYLAYLTAHGGKCQNNGFEVTVSSSAGARGPVGPQGPAGSQGPQGPAGPAGPAGSSAVVTVSAQTVVTNWPESSGWGTDNFTRNVTLTREGAVPAADCGAAATSCYFYTETLADNGTVTTVDGHASPNGSSTDKIKGAWTGPMTGGGKLEFYASSDSPDPKLVPGTASGTMPPSTTTAWERLFFPAGTAFGAKVTWVTYDWVYTVQVTCGTSSTVSEKWNDGINPGDDGQGAADGNITGATACP